jgi:PTS system mannose-specific IIB component/fructoselysine and glucoselysine-specific PTS system IIB component
MSLVLYRIDDRLIHGQVVIGWGRPLDVGFIALVDDQVAASDWEQDSTAWECHPRSRFSSRV